MPKNVPALPGYRGEQPAVQPGRRGERPRVPRRPGRQRPRRERSPSPAGSKPRRGRCSTTSAGCCDAAGLDYARRRQGTVYLRDFADFDAMNRVYREYFPTEPPTRATVGVTALARDFRVEIEVIAARLAPAWSLLVTTSSSIATRRWPGVVEDLDREGVRPEVFHEALYRTRRRIEARALEVDGLDRRRRRCRIRALPRVGPTGPYQAIRLPVKVMVAVAPAPVA